MLLQYINVRRKLNHVRCNYKIYSEDVVYIDTMSPFAQAF